MLNIIIPTVMLIPLVWLSNYSIIWISSTVYSLIISLSSLFILNHFNNNILSSSVIFFSDSQSTPLLILTTWLPSPILVGSQHQLAKNPLNWVNLCITILVLLQVFLMITFTAMELIIFCILFNATLLPTLIIITRWTIQTERLNTGLFLILRVTIGSLPLLVAQIYIQNLTGSLNLLLTEYWIQPLPTS